MITKTKRSRRKFVGQINVRLEEDMFRAVENIARADRRELAQIARFAIEEYIERHKVEVPAA